MEMLHMRERCHETPAAKPFRRWQQRPAENRRIVFKINLRRIPCCPQLITLNRRFDLFAIDTEPMHIYSREPEDWSVGTAENGLVVRESKDACLSTEVTSAVAGIEEAHSISEPSLLVLLSHSKPVV